MKGRQGGTPENGYSSGQPVHGSGSFLKAFQEGAGPPGPVIGPAHIHEGTPERGLPVIISPVFPAKNPVGAVKHVLVQGICDLIGQLKPLQGIPVPFDIMTDRSERLLPGQGREQGQNSPG